MLENVNYTKVKSYDSLDKTKQEVVYYYLMGLIQGALAMAQRFTTADVVGGKNTHWFNTPLYHIFKYHQDNAARDPEQESAKDVGRLLKNVMVLDPRHKYKIVGKVQRRFPSNLYAYDDEEQNGI